jgi:hypothetical protein
MALGVAVSRCTRERPAPVIHADPMPSALPSPSVAPPSPAPSVSPTPSVDPIRWWCRTDADCTMSCGYGAVSRAWWRAHVSPPWPLEPAGSTKANDCRDGCEMGHGAPRCLDGACVAWAKRMPGGSIDAFCTHLLDPDAERRLAIAAGATSASAGR